MFAAWKRTRFFSPLSSDLNAQYGAGAKESVRFWEERSNESEEPGSNSFGGALGLFLALYIAAKFDFFMRYDPLRVRTYLQEHRIYWAGIAALGLVIWLMEKRFPHQKG